jgi:hypothetical protein
MAPTPSDKPRKVRARSFTAKEVETLAAQLKKIAVDMEATAKEMVESKFADSLRIDGGEMIHDATKSALRWYYRISEAYASAQLKMPGDDLTGGDPPSDQKSPKRKK